MSEETWTITKPGDRSQALHLRPDTSTALAVHTDLLAGRCDDGTPWTGRERLDRIAEQAATNPILAQLVALAEHLAANVADPWDTAARWTAATVLVAEHNRLDPLPIQQSYAYDETDTCRHGRLFTADCPDCEI